MGNKKSSPRRLQVQERERERVTHVFKCKRGRGRERESHPDVYGLSLSRCCIAERAREKERQWERERVEP
jgi:hypothetical protein